MTAAILLLILLSGLTSAAAVFLTECLQKDPRSRRERIILFGIGLIFTMLFSVIAEVILKAGRPTFYYHTHRPGRYTLKLFGLGCLLSGLIFSLSLIFFGRKNLRSGLVSWLVRCALIAALGSLILEFAWFNQRHYELMLTDVSGETFDNNGLWGDGFYFNRALWKWVAYEKKSGPFGVTVYPHHAKIRNFRIVFEDDSEAERIPFTISYNDRSHREKLKIPTHELISYIPRSQYVPLETVGETEQLSIHFTDMKKYRKYQFNMQIEVNSVVPLDIKPLRILLSFLLIFIIGVFLPGSPLWEIRLDLRRPVQVCLVLCELGAFLILLTWTSFSSYSSSDLPISEQKTAVTRNHTQYDRLVEALMVPQYALLDKPDHELAQLSDPYDMGQREKLGFHYLWDTAYYNDRYYVYFGIVPAVLVLLPYRMLTGRFLELDHPILGFGILTILGLYLLYSQIVRRSFPKMKLGIYLIGLVLLFTPLNLTWVLRRGLVYELAIVSGLCFAVWGLALAYTAADAGAFRQILLFGAGCASALAVGCRPTMLLASLVSIIVMLRGFGKKGFLKALLFFLPYAAIGLVLMKYNYERFDDPLEFGITYQLTTENEATGLPRLGIRGILFSALCYLFNLPKIDFEFPFIHPTVPEIPYNGFLLNSDPVLGIFAFPVMLFLLLLPFYHKALRERSRSLSALCISAPLIGILICGTASYFSVTNRYVTDFAWLFALPAVILYFCSGEQAEEKENARLLRGIGLICCVFGCGLCLALSLSGEQDWFRLLNPRFFDKLRYAFSPWL